MMKRGWVWLLTGLVGGLIAGLVYTWVLKPVAFYDTYPPLMREDFRADWVRMTGLAYGNEGDLTRAHLRLKDLPPDEIQSALTQALDSAVASGRPLPVLQRLATLAQAYGANNAAIRIYASDEVLLFTPTPTPVAITPTATATAIQPTLTPTKAPTPEPVPHVILPTPTPLPPPYTISQTVKSCLPEPRIAISLTESVTVTLRGRERQQINGLPGREIWLLWTGGADHAFTGLRPAQGSGYADFHVEPEQLYNLYIEMPTGAPVTTLKIEACTTKEGKSGWSSWLIVLLATEKR
ncbi:MAG: hypothetical protein JW892_15225 [Anaerolineae bacterium]|nr:hypothetical protein [Anaerolineae bacterium]